MTDLVDILTQATAQKKISPVAAQAIHSWLTEPAYADYQPELIKLLQEKKWQELEDSFFQVVPFGTGGRRGTVGMGPNRINKITIGQSAQGLATYLLKIHGDTAKQRGVVIAYDTRLTSEEFAKHTAATLVHYGFTTYLFDSFRATPELSFAVRHLKAVAGIVISASHNPPSDNGFKVYWEDGGQIVPPHDHALMTQVEAALPLTDLKPYSTANSLLKIVSSEIDEAYLNALINESVSASRSASLVYSPLHGAGISSVYPVLKRAGFTNVSLVKEQSQPDGNFPSVPQHLPNPEIPSATEAATQYAQQLRADLALTTDPDADRLGVVVRDEHGQYQRFNGNQIAALLGYFVLSQLTEQKKLTSQHFIAKTIVTTDFLNAMADDFGIKIYDDLLVGFKYIAELINLKSPQEQFIFGGEESHGILKGTYTRDKDAAIAALLMSEFVSWLKDQGRTLTWQLHQLFRRYGIYWETLVNVSYPGAQGLAQLNQLLKNLRKNPPLKLGNEKIIRFIDRQTSPGTKGNVLVLWLSEDGRRRLTLRPSGTEPKLKLYAQVHTPVSSKIPDRELTEHIQKTETDAASLLTTLQKHLDSLI